jgi:hypothetical protein
MKLLTFMLVILFTGFVSAQASTVEETVIKDVEKSHQVTCGFLKDSLSFFLTTTTALYVCLDENGNKKAEIKFKYQCEERGKLLEVGKILSFAVTFNP